MKIHRLALRDYRGIASTELELAPVGVTLVHGPNEVGKSSLAEALELLFDERDSTTRQRVRQVQPVDRDAGAEIEADVELGPLRFRYAKRFHRKPQTRLAIQAPRVENWTGREAHERVQALLGEHLDVALWRALRQVQGEGLVQPALHDAPSLAEALDRAAGVSGGGDREESLFEAARALFAEHYTPTGRPRSELGRLESEAQEAAREVAELETELAALERDAERERTGQRELAELEMRLTQLSTGSRELEAALEQVRSMREACRRGASECEAAEARHEAAQQRARQRSQLVSAHAGAAAEVESLAEVVELEEPAHLTAAAELRHVEERLDGARAARAEAGERTRCARRDAGLLRAEAELTALGERRRRAASELAELERARAVLAGPPLDRAQVRAIATAQGAVERAQARLETDGPSVQLEPLRELELVLDGRRLQLSPGERLEERVSESLLLEVPGLGSLRVVAGAGVAEQRKALEQAETRLRTLCMEAGVEDHPDAERRLTAQRTAADEARRAERRLADALAGATPEELETREREGSERLRRSRAGRPGDTPLPDSLEAAERAVEAAEADEARARETLEDLERRRADVAERFEGQRERRNDTHRRLELAQQNRADFERRLLEARAELSDEVIEGRLEQSLRESRAREEQAREAEAQLAALEPEALTRRAEELAEERSRCERELREQRDALLRLRERLEVNGSRGLFDAHQRARRRQRQAEQAWQSRRRRALAAARLYNVLHEEREASRSYYAEPLAREIARLGQPLFGTDFQVELDEELRVDRRILAGLNLAESQLSAGAREQLALITRVAAARLAGGVPLWIDDALGHSDAERLERLGPVLAAAAESSQVVVLTCAPERFESVPVARAVELPAPDGP